MEEEQKQRIINELAEEVASINRLYLNAQDLWKRSSVDISAILNGIDTCLFRESLMFVIGIKQVQDLEGEWIYPEDLSYSLSEADTKEDVLKIINEYK